MKKIVFIASLLLALPLQAAEKFNSLSSVLYSLNGKTVKVYMKGGYTFKGVLTSHRNALYQIDRTEINLAANQKKVYFDVSTVMAVENTD